MSDWIAATFTSTAGWDLLEDLVDIRNRMAGQPGEHEGLERTRDALAEAGARDARIEEFDLQGWIRGDSHVATPAGVEEESIGLPRTPAGDVSAELVDLGYGLPEDFEDADVDGKVVMVSSIVPDWFDRYIHRTEKYRYAVENGAAAFIYRNHVDGCLPPTGGVGADDDPIGEIPAVGVSKEVGTRLGRRFDGDEVTVHVDCETPETTSGNAVAELGPDTAEHILLTSHVDAHDIAEGAWDNGTGTASVVQVAEALAAREDDLDTRVKLACFGAEEVGLHGSHHLAEETDPETVKAVVNCDANAYGRSLKLYTHRFDELEAAAERVGDRFDHPISTVPRMVPHSDHWPFVQRGVPGYMVSSESDTEGRGWGHTEADTLDKLESRTLREQAILLTELVVDLADDDVAIEHEDPARIASYLEEEDKAEGMRKTGSWPFDE